MDNITITFNIPDYSSVGKTETIHYKVDNPLDFPVEVYISIVKNGQIVTSDTVYVDALGSVEGDLEILIDEIPYNFEIHAEAYANSEVIAEASVSTSIEGFKREKNIALGLIPILIGIGSIVMGGRSG